MNYVWSEDKFSETLSFANGQGSPPKAERVSKTGE